MSICTVQITLPPCEDYVTVRCCLPVAPPCQAEHRYCRRVWRRFSICDFSRFRYCYVYHRGVDCFKNACGCTLVIKFGIAVKYINCHGERRARIFEDSVRLTGLAEDFDLSESRLRLTDLTCEADGRGCITAGFSAMLQTD